MHAFMSTQDQSPWLHVKAKPAKSTKSTDADDQDPDSAQDQ
jgi:hypothetical protein